MKHSQKMKYILGICMLVVGIFSIIITVKSLRPSPGKKFEQLEMTQALEYMTYEEGYILADVGTTQEYEKGHIPGSISFPYDDINPQNVYSAFPDQTQQIYIYGRSLDINEKAAAKLCEMGYINITEIGCYNDWLKLESEMGTDLVISDGSITALGG